MLNFLELFVVFLLAGQIAVADPYPTVGLEPQRIKFDGNIDIDDFTIYTLSPVYGVMLTPDPLATVHEKYYKMSSLLRDNISGHSFFTFLCFGASTSMQIESAQAVYFNAYTTCWSVKKEYTQKIDDYVSTLPEFEFYNGRRMKWSKPKILTYNIVFDVISETPNKRISIYKELTSEEVKNLIHNLDRAISSENSNKEELIGLIKPLGVSDEQSIDLLKMITLEKTLEISFWAIVNDSLYLPYYSPVGISYEFECPALGCFKQ